jgi:LysM repeat protein
MIYKYLFTITRMKKIRVNFLILAFLTLMFDMKAQKEESLQILKTSAQKCLQLKGMKFRLIMQERVNKKMILSDAFVKVNFFPIQVYLKQTKPKAGLEILYKEGARNNNMLIFTNGFPWVNVTYSPYAHTVHKESHHNIKRSGLYFIGKIMDRFLKKESSTIQITKLADEIYDGKSCFKMSIEETAYSKSQHIVQKGETIHSIADKYFLSTHAILENNLAVIDDYDETLHEGEKLSIPNSYGKKIILFIDKKNYLPIKIVVEDEKGLYEVYDYLNVEINPVFKENEFEETFTGYGF